MAGHERASTTHIKLKLKVVSVGIFISDEQKTNLLPWRPAGLLDACVV